MCVDLTMFDLSGKLLEQQGSGGRAERSLGPLDPQPGEEGGWSGHHLPGHPRAHHLLWPQVRRRVGGGPEPPGPDCAAGPHQGGHQSGSVG